MIRISSSIRSVSRKKKKKKKNQSTKQTISRHPATLPQRIHHQNDRTDPLYPTVPLLENRSHPFCHRTIFHDPDLELDPRLLVPLRRAPAEPGLARRAPLPREGLRAPQPVGQGVPRKK
jgi:hypothetical protein